MFAIPLRGEAMVGLCGLCRGRRGLGTADAEAFDVGLEEDEVRRGIFEDAAEASGICCSSENGWRGNEIQVD